MCHLTLGLTCCYKMVVFKHSLMTNTCYSFNVVYTTVWKFDTQTVQRKHNTFLSMTIPLLTSSDLVVWSAVTELPEVRCWYNGLLNAARLWLMTFTVGIISSRTGGTLSCVTYSTSVLTWSQFISTRTLICAKLWLLHQCSGKIITSKNRQEALLLQRNRATRYVSW